MGNKATDTQHINNKLFCTSLKDSYCRLLLKIYKQK